MIIHARSLSKIIFYISSYFHDPKYEKYDDKIACNAPSSSWSLVDDRKSNRCGLLFKNHRARLRRQSSGNQLTCAITLYNTATAVARIFPLRRSLNRRILCATSRHSRPIEAIQSVFKYDSASSTLGRTILHSQGGGDGHPRLLCFSKSRPAEAPAPRIAVNYIMHSNRDSSRVESVSCDEGRSPRYKGCHTNVNVSQRQWLSPHMALCALTFEIFYGSSDEFLFEWHSCNLSQIVVWFNIRERYLYIASYHRTIFFSERKDSFWEQNLFFNSNDYQV